MDDNARLADLILHQISGEDVNDKAQGEMVDLLQVALQDGRSRLDLRNRLVAGARDSNKITQIDIVEVMTQSLSDEVRDLDETVAEMENDLVPSRLALGSMVGLVLGTTGTLFYGITDPVVSFGLIGVLGTAAVGITMLRKRAFHKASALRKKRANYENFRVLLQELK